MAVHTILPPPLTDAVDAVLRSAGEPHVAHGDGDPVGAAVAAVEAGARAIIGPFRSADVNEALAATAGVPLLAPVATWAGITRDDEPGCDDAPDHRGTVLRMVARDTVVAQRIAERLRGRRALVIAGDHEYGLQLDGIQGESFPGQDVEIALVYAPGPLGVAESRRAAELVLASRDLEEMRRLGGFDEHGDPLDPLVRFERYDAA
jgi:hypothetical protein